MSNLEQTLARRAALIEQAALQRKELSAKYNQFQRPAAIFDQGYAMARSIKSHPGIAFGATFLLGLVLTRRGAIGKLAGVAVKAARLAMSFARF